LIGVKRNQQTRWRGANKLPPHINVGDTEIGDTELLYEPGVFPDETRHHILAEMLRVDDKEMPWRGSRSAACGQSISHAGGLLRLRHASEGGCVQ
jgi:hypothetical protein